MQSLLFAMPLKPGMLDEYKAFAAEITGPRKKEFNDMLNRYGHKTARVWYHKFSDKEYVLVFHDNKEGTLDRLQSWGTSTHPFDCWFKEQIVKYYDIKDFNHLPEQPQFLFGLDAE